MKTTIPPIPRPTEGPQWFLDAVARPWEDRSVTVQGQPIYYHLYDNAPQHAPTLVFVHGGSAHRHWWDHIAGMLDDKYRIIAVDLPGMGDSGHYESYDSKLFAESVFRCCEALPPRDAPLYICGHSFGGAITLETQRLFTVADGLIIVDSPIIPNPGMEPPQPRPLIPRPRLSATREELLKRFRLMPEQECKNDFVIRYIAESSIKFVEFEDESGWCWKFDPNRYARTEFRLSNRETWLKSLNVPMYIINGELSVFGSEKSVQWLRENTAEMDAKVDVMPNVHHHLILEEPPGFVKLIQRQLAAWDATVRT